MSHVVSSSLFYPVVFGNDSSRKNPPQIDYNTYSLTPFFSPPQINYNTYNLTPFLSLTKKLS